MALLKSASAPVLLMRFLLRYSRRNILIERRDSAIISAPSSPREVSLKDRSVIEQLLQRTFATKDISVVVNWFSIETLRESIVICSPPNFHFSISFTSQSRFNNNRGEWGDWEGAYVHDSEGENFAPQLPILGLEIGRQDVEASNSRKVYCAYQWYVHSESRGKPKAKPFEGP
mmetsp:Transcript_27967/g.82238  ORF Transcript_27967/g.82238 Transcript_27967/m.82238 type:complete len:173 (-) Transcript_27967:203-721(-)